MNSPLSIPFNHARRGALRRTAQAAGLAAAALLAACAASPRVTVPDAIAAEPHQSLALTVGASGVQIYECRAAGTQGYRWTFVAPEAALLDGDGRTIGSHGAGPHWTFDDGARVTGRVKAHAAAPAAGAIPWLLLEARGNPQRDRLSHLRSIQRINTEGGVAPADGCDARRAGSQLRVPYRAHYLFYAGR